MNIFFYTASGSGAAQYYLERLQRLPVLKEMTILPTGELFRSPVALKLRSGDLLLLFATDKKELNELLELRNELNDFRIIMILADSKTQRKAHALNPCFIAFPEEEMVKVEAVIKKIIGSDQNNHKRPGFIAYLADSYLWRLKVFTPSFEIALLFSLIA